MTHTLPAERVNARLVALRAELVDGERVLAELDARRERLVSSMLRIGGAIQVLAELVASEGTGDGPAMPGTGAAPDRPGIGGAPARPDHRAAEAS